MNRHTVTKHLKRKKNYAASKFLLAREKVHYSSAIRLYIPFLAIAAHAQDLIWAKQAGGVDLDLGSNIAVDADGNCYVVGVFEGLATFGSGDNETRLTSTGLSSIFIAKYSAEASLLWAKTQAWATLQKHGRKLPWMGPVRSI